MEALSLAVLENAATRTTATNPFFSPFPPSRIKYCTDEEKKMIVFVLKATRNILYIRQLHCFPILVCILNQNQNHPVPVTLHCESAQTLWSACKLHTIQSIMCCMERISTTTTRRQKTACEAVCTLTDDRPICNLHRSPPRTSFESKTERRRLGIGQI